MKRLQRQITKLEKHNAALELRVKDQQSEQLAREEEVRAQQLAHTQTVNLLFSKIKALRTTHRN